MTRTLERAMSRVAGLPEAAQEHIGREVLAHVAKLRELRTEIMKGIRSLDEGKAREIDIQAFLKRVHARHAKETRKAKTR